MVRSQSSARLAFPVCCVKGQRGQGLGVPLLLVSQALVNPICLDSGRIVFLQSGHCEREQKVLSMF